MSHVTDIILVTAIEDGEDEKFPNIDLLNLYLMNMHNCTALKQVDDYAGGNKCVQVDIFITAIDGLDIEAFLEQFHSLKWNDPGRVQLMIKDEHDERFKIYNVEGN